MNAESIVLLVDDDESIREFVTLALSDEGYDIATAPHGAAALEYINNNPPALILLDMRMPVMDGWTFAKKYRKLANAAAPIVVLTAARDAGEIAEQIKADYFLAKPFDLQALIDVVDRFTRGHHSVDISSNLL